MAFLWLAFLEGSAEFEDMLSVAKIRMDEVSKNDKNIKGNGQVLVGKFLCEYLKSVSSLHIMSPHLIGCGWARRMTRPSVFANLRWWMKIFSVAHKKSIW